MKTITDYRNDAILNKLYRFPFGTGTFKQIIDRGEVLKAFEVEAPKYRYSRSQYNRTDQQEAYEKKLAAKKTIYELHTVHGKFEVPKAVFLYATEGLQPTHIEYYPCNQSDTKNQVIEYVLKS
jgi:5-bromo-4-chloroindolyl phosphate hydrolysis protein